MVDAGQRFEWSAFRTWVLADYGMAAGSWKYYSSRIRTMARDYGLDLEAAVTDPRTLKRQGADVIANSKLPRVVKGKMRPPSGHVTRNFQRALNWLSDYGRALELEDLRYQLGRGADDQDLEERVRRWHRWELAPEPPSSPKSVDAPDLGIFRTYVHARCTGQCLRTQPAGRAHCYTTYLRRGIADVALAGNFRRGEMEQTETTGLFPHLGKIHLAHAMKGSVSGDVDVPWSLFWPESGLMQYLQVRAPVEGNDALFTVPGGHGYGKPRALGGAAIYVHLYEMGKELGVPLNLVRTKRRALSDIDEQRVDVRVTQAKGRHVKIENTITYLGRVTSSRQRRELAERGVAGYSAEDALRVVDLAGRPVFATAIGPPVPRAYRDGVVGAPLPEVAADEASSADPAGRAGLGGGVPGGEGRDGQARRDSNQRDGRPQRAGPAAPAATRGVGSAPPSSASCQTCGALLSMPLGPKNQSALYGAHGLPQPAQFDAGQRVGPGTPGIAPGQELAGSTANPDPSSYIDLETWNMQNHRQRAGSLTIVKKGAINAWRPTEAGSTASAGLPAAAKPLNPTDLEKVGERAFTGSRAVAPTGATGERRRFTSHPATRAATPAEMQARLGRPMASPSSIARRTCVEVLA